jgi:hypothetical protein
MRGIPRKIFQEIKELTGGGSRIRTTPPTSQPT